MLRKGTYAEGLGAGGSVVGITGAMGGVLRLEAALLTLDLRSQPTRRA